MDFNENPKHIIEELLKDPLKQICDHLVAIGLRF